MSKGSLASTAALLALLASVLAPPALADEDPSLIVTGVVAITADGAGPSAHIITGNTAVPVEPDAVAGLATGTEVSAELAISESTVRELDLRTDVAAESALGEAVVDDADAPLEAESLEVIRTAAAAPATGVHEVDIAINIGATGGVPQPTEAQVRAAIAEVSDYWVANTGGAFPGLHVRGVIQYTTTLTCGSAYSDTAWASEAAARFERSLNHYVDESQADHLVVVGECRRDSKAAIGTVGESIASGGFVLTQADFFSYSDALAILSGLLAHEFGHNFGLNHSNAPQISGCTVTGVPLYTDITTCGTEEYADAWSIMGYAVGISDAPLLDVARREQLGVTDSTTLASQSGVVARTYALSSLGAEGGLKGVKIAVSSGTYYVEYRDGTGEPDALYLYDRGCTNEWEPSATCTVASGINPEGPGVRVIRLQAEGATRVSAVRTRSDVPAFSELALDAGDKWLSTTGDATIKIVSAADGTANLVVTTGKPTIAGSIRVAATASASIGTWPGDFTMKYQWLRDGSTIAGATAGTYVPTASDAGKKLAVRVTGTHPELGSVSVTSSGVTVALGALSAPIPTITGSARVGQTLAANRGTWTSGTTAKYRWYANGVAISGAVWSKLKVPSSVVGKKITVKVTGVKSGYATKTVTSASVGVPRVGKATITGTARARFTLAAHHGTWTTGTYFKYQWYASGVAIPGATKSTYWVQTAYVGKVITVKITGSKSGYTTVTLTSPGTARVAR